LYDNGQDSCTILLKQRKKEPSSNEVIYEKKNMPIVDDRNAKKVIVSEVNNDKDNSKLNKHENNISNGKKIYFLILN
jgi:hypothetical protein